jgi:hypothetical protein
MHARQIQRRLAAPIVGADLDGSGAERCSTDLTEIEIQTSGTPVDTDLAEVRGAGEGGYVRDVGNG